MKEKLRFAIGSLLFLCMVLTSCSSDRGIYHQVSDINGQKLGVVCETPGQNRLDSLFDTSTIRVYDKAVNLFLDIEAGKCEVALLDEETAIRVISRNTDYGCLDVLSMDESGKVYVVVPKWTIAQEVWETPSSDSWWKRWGARIYRNLIDKDAWRLIQGGLYTTLVIFFFGAIWAIALASLLTYMHINHRWMWLYRPLHWFVFNIHDVPSVVLMMFFYYVVFASVASVNGICVSIIALGVYTSGTLTKIFTIHIEQVGTEQREAGKMLGFTPRQIYRYIILPQAVKSMLSLVIGEMKVLLRATSYAGYIAQKDLVKAVDAIRAQTFDAFVPLFIVGLLYLALSWMIAHLFKLLYAKFFAHD